MRTLIAISAVLAALLSPFLREAAAQRVSPAGVRIQSSGAGGLVAKPVFAVAASGVHGAPLLPAALALPRTPPDAVEVTGWRAVFDGSGRQAFSFGDGLPSPPGRSGAPAEDAVWTALERWVAQGSSPARLPSDSGRAWKAETIRLLRDHPDLPLERALARAFSATARLDADKAARIETLLSGRPQLEVKGSIYGFTEFEGRLYAFGKGVYELGDSGWKPVPLDGITPDIVYQIEALDATLHAATDKGLFRLEADGWKRIFWPLVKSVHRVDGIIYVADLSGQVHRWDPDGWTNILPSRFADSMWGIGSQGKLYVGRTDGLFVLDGDAPPVQVETDFSFYGLVASGGRLYAQSLNAVYRLEKDSWAPVRLADGETPERIAVVDGRLYAYRGDEVHVLEASGWKKLFSVSNFNRLFLGRQKDRHIVGFQDSIHLFDGKTETTIPLPGFEGVRAAFDRGGTLQLGNFKGLWSLPLPPQTLAAGWRDTVLADLSSGIEAQRRRAPAEYAGDDGLVDAHGRSVFGLAADLRPAAPRGWDILQAWIEEALDLQLTPEQLPKWKQAAAEILRNNPSLPLETALAAALSKTVAIEQASVRTLLESQRVPELPGAQRVSRVLEVGGTLFALGANGLYAREKGKTWKRMDHHGRSPIYQIFSLDGKLIAATHTGHFGLGPDGWRARAVPYLPHLTALARHGDKVYAASEGNAKKGLFVLDEETSEWEAVFDGDIVYQILRLDGKLHFLTPGGLYVQEDETWAAPPIKLGNNRMLWKIKWGMDTDPFGSILAPERDLFNFSWDMSGADGKVYAATNDGVYVNETRGFRDWKKVSEDRASAVYVVGKSIYFALETGGLWRWEPEPAPWRDAVLSDLGRMIAASPAPPAPETSHDADPFAEDADGVVRSEDGRMIFNGLRGRIGRLLGR